MSQDPSAAAADASADSHRSPNERLGLVLFAFYLLVYAGFVGISAFKYEWMGQIVLFGLNLAIVYGMGLILLAMLLAGVYMFLCKPEPQAPAEAAEI